MIFQIFDTIMVTAFVLFLIYIFRGYHLSRIDQFKKEDSTSN
ncbi:MAG: hypothetical protein Q8N01_06900 [Sulfuricurvum sp.]|nr:hypothetical protein [Sulfuricurvum sp.]MDP3021749.1 hypothetical protein [Sulfuricurvum sp.]MDP3120125.1 hypothetical protein [Sulfuricurvum sp.]